MFRTLPCPSALLPILLILIRAACCGAAALPPDPPQPGEAWAAQPTAQWPQLVLTNAATFTGHTPMEGASSFLVRMPDGLVYLGTAKHLIKAAGGVDPVVPIEALDSALDHWTAYPRTRPTDAVIAKGRAVTLNHEVGHDWLLLHLSDPAARLPSTPLVARRTPVAVGETVYLVGVPYTDNRSAQNVYKGVVTGRPLDHYFTYEFTPAVKINGFSGAPIVDAHGLLVGHGVSRTKLKTDAAGLATEFGGEDASYLLHLWKHRDDAPSGPVLAARHVELPAGWTPRQSKSRAVLQYAMRGDPSGAFELFGEPKSDFEEGYTLADYARDRHTLIAKAPASTDQQLTEPKSVRYGKVPAIEFDATVTLKATTVKYRRVDLEVGGCYCELVFWSSAAGFAAAEPKFKEVVAALK